MINEKEIAATFTKFAETLDVLNPDENIEVLAIIISEKGKCAVLHSCDPELAVFMLVDALKNYNLNNATLIPRQDN